MQIRIVSFRVPQQRLKEIENAYSTSLLPEMEAHPGFTSLLILRNENTGNTLELTLWEDEVSLLETERKGGLLEWKLNALEAITNEATGIEDYTLRFMS